MDIRTYVRYTVKRNRKELIWQQKNRKNENIVTYDTVILTMGGMWNMMIYRTNVLLCAGLD